MRRKVVLTILIVEDELHNREVLLELIQREGHQVTLAQNGQEALELALKNSFDLILSDIRMPVMDGLVFFDTFLKLSAKEKRLVPFFAFMTAYGRTEDAVEVLRRGAFHFLKKPLRKKDIIELLSEVEKVLKNKSRNLVYSSKEVSSELVYSSKIINDLLRTLDQVAQSQAPILLIGESGTGKELLAKRVHQSSQRNQGPLIVFQAGSVPETLIESELFGHKKGAFTGADQDKVGLIAKANGGTFFIDELSSMTPNVQVKLLRVLQEKKVLPLGAASPIDCDVRWVTATNVPIDELLLTHQFREDFLYRLRVVELEIPPLRERSEDIIPLVLHFLKEFSERDHKPLMSLDPQVSDILETYLWPGNVRELKNVIERAVALSEKDILDLSLLPEHLTKIDVLKEIKFKVGTSLKSIEDQVIEETLKSCGGDKNQTAAILGVAPRTIYRWLEKKQESGL